VSTFALGEIVHATGARLLRGEASMRVAGVSTDTRTLRPGELYVGLTGPRFDGNEFAAAACEAGAAALLLRADGGASGRGFQTPLIVHADPRAALAELARWHRRRLAVPVVGITGSAGKTSTKDILSQLLGTQLNVAASPKSFNNDVGVPLTLLLADAATRAIVCELGTNRPGEIASLARIAEPTGGIVTIVGQAHLEQLGSPEGVAREKGALLEALPADGFAVLNLDDRFAGELARRTRARPITISVDGDGEFDASHVWFHSGGTSFRLRAPGWSAPVELVTPQLGTHSVRNLLMALAACHGLGLAIEPLLPAIPLLAGAQQRMERRELAGVTLFDDSYNANPDSARAAVRTLAGLHGYQRRVLVLGDMLELGAQAGELHHKLGAEAAQAGIDLLVLVGELARAAAAGALEAGMDPARVVHFADTPAAAQALDTLIETGDVVLVKGSRRMQLERVAAALASARGERGRLRAAGVSAP
jgi:UDP-N-acetylmuramoyl-tripeptide--D-alanyl-D-alanine ligase